MKRLSGESRLVTMSVVITATLADLGPETGRHYPPDALTGAMMWRSSQKWTKTAKAGDTKEFLN
jgi:hypothetical protein